LEEARRSAPPPQVVTAGSAFELMRQGGGNPASAVAAKPSGPPPRPAGLVPGFGHYLRFAVADGVHSGSGRTRLNDDNTDYYPVSLKEETLRPGTVYADPYGHLLVLAKRLPQSEGAAGVLLAVDAQPDGTV